MSSTRLPDFTKWLFGEDTGDLGTPALKLKLELLVTLWPSFPHFERFATDTRLHGIRLNSAMITAPEARDPELLKKLDAVAGGVLR